MLPEEKKNEEKKNNSNIKKNSKLFNFNYDYNITTFNKRTALFDKNKSNIIMELSEKIDKNKIFLVMSIKMKIISKKKKKQE